MHQKYHLAQNSRGSWEIRWSEAGRSQRHSTRTGDLGEAQAYLSTWSRARETAVAELAVPVKPTVRELIERYVEAGRERGIRTSQSYVLRAVDRGLGELRLDELDSDALDTYRRERLASVTRSSARRELGALSAVLNWAAKPGRELIKRSELPYIELPPEGQPRELWLDEKQEAEFHRLALTWRLTRIGRYVAIGLGTGARKEAIQELRWDKVDLDAGLIDFRVAGRKMTNKRRVPAPINDRLRAVLEAIPENLRWGRVVGDGDCRIGYRSFAASTPWPWVTSHVMRHTFITLNLRAGLDCWEVAQLVGDTPEMVSKHYGHHQADWKLRDAANRRFAKIA